MVKAKKKTKHVKKTFVKKLDEEFIWNRRTVGHFFLGVGLTMFIVNIATILNLMMMYSGGYPLAGYYISIASSVILMVYSLYNIYVEE